MIKKKETKKTGDLQGAMDEIKQRFGDGAIMKLKDVRAVDVDAISTGSISLDLALGVEGVPRGRVIEIYGPESSGKTSLALHILAEAQKQGGIGAFIDAEHAMDPDYAKKIGVNINELLISQPDSGEQALQIVETLVRSEEVDVIFLLNTTGPLNSDKVSLDDPPLILTESANVVSTPFSSPVTVVIGASNISSSPVVPLITL